LGQLFVEEVGVDELFEVEEGVAAEDVFEL